MQVHPSERMCHPVGMLAVRPFARGRGGVREALRLLEFAVNLKLR